MNRIQIGLLISAVSLFSVAHSTFAADETKKLALQESLLSAAPEVPSYTIANEVPLAWEAHHPERKLWSQYAFEVIDLVFDELDQSKDMAMFCPKYVELTHDQKVEAWGQVIAGVSYWETTWNPANRSEEGPDVDPITQKTVCSEGLLQLSYQDGDPESENDPHPYCKFDYEADQKLSPKDLHRSILNPYNNLYCGIRILADLVQKNGDVSPQSGQHGYWSTLDSVDRLHNRSSQIAESTHSLSFCGAPQKGAFDGFFLKLLKKGDPEYRKAKALLQGRAFEGSNSCS